MKNNNNDYYEDNAYFPQEAHIVGMIESNEENKKGRIGIVLDINNEKDETVTISDMYNTAVSARFENEGNEDNTIDPNFG